MGPIFTSELALLSCVLDPRVKPFVDDCRVELLFMASDKEKAYMALRRYLQFMVHQSSRLAVDAQPIQVAAQLPDDGASTSDSDPGDDDGAAPRRRGGRHALHDSARHTLYSLLDNVMGSINSAQASSDNMTSQAIAADHEASVYQAASFVNDVRDYNLKFSAPPVGSAATPLVQTILEWWKKRGSAQFPLIREVARLVLAIPATSAPSERVFSTSERVCGRLRSRLAPDAVQAIVREHEASRARNRKVVSLDQAPG